MLLWFFISFFSIFVSSFDVSKIKYFFLLVLAILTKAFSGRMARGINNKFIQRMVDKTILPFPAQNTLTGPLRKVSVAVNNGEYINLWAGKNFKKARTLSAFELMSELKKEFIEIKKR